MNSGDNEIPPNQGNPDDARSLCGGCGKPITTNFVFCPHCGSTLSAGPAPGSANPSSQASTGLVRSKAASLPPAPGTSRNTIEEIVELDDVTYEEVVACWRCELNNPPGTPECIHCEAPLKVKGNKKAGKSKLPFPPKRPGRLASPNSPAPAARAPQVPPPIPPSSPAASESPFRPREGSERKEPPSSAPGIPQPIPERQQANSLPFQTPKPPAKLSDEIEVLDDAEISLVEEGAGSTSLMPRTSSQPGPVREGSFKATVYSRKTSRPGKTRTESARHSRSHIIFPVLIGYGLMMSVTIAMCAARVIAQWKKFDLPSYSGVIFELLDTLVVLWLVFHCKLENFGGVRKVFAWVSAFPALAALYSGNIILSDWRNRMLGYEDSDHRESTPADAEPIDFHEIVTTSIQPGVIEELFCRHLLQGSLQKLTGPHTAIWIAAAMFALLHLYNPLGVPYLFLCGLVLGYYRYWSGSLVLPMTMHALHNFAVMLGTHFR